MKAKAKFATAGKNSLVCTVPFTKKALHGVIAFTIHYNYRKIGEVINTTHFDTLDCVISKCSILSTVNGVSVNGEEINSKHDTTNGNVDMQLNGYNNEHDDGESSENESISTTIIDFLVECVERRKGSLAIPNQFGAEIAIKLVLPTVSGYLARQDFLERRLLMCEGVELAKGFIKARQFCNGFTEVLRSPMQILTAAAMVVGGILHDGTTNPDPIDGLYNLEAELTNRLSFHWLTADPIPRKCLALLAGRRHPAVSSAPEGVFRAAEALDIGLVVIDKKGHWIEDAQYSYLRDAFLPIDMTDNEGLGDRAAAAIREYQRQGGTCDGITTFSDKYLVSVARAATLLGFHTGPIESFEICVNKYQTRLLHPIDVQCQFVSDYNEFCELEKTGQLPQWHYPLVVKHHHGTHSEGVYLCKSHTELHEGVKRISKSEYLSQTYGSGLIIETYVDGPEIDVNIVPLDGEIIFKDINDDFPSAGDEPSADAEATFLEVGNVVPSRLPQSEIDMLYAQIQKTLRRLGYTIGCFHIEARVLNSSMKYVRDERGIMDLWPNLLYDPSKPPQLFMLEINARLPGFGVSFLTEFTSGVDYYALYMLFAIGERERPRALAHGFLNGPPYHCERVSFPVEQGGIYDSDDLFEDIARRLPELSKHICKSRSFYKRGDVIPDPSTGMLFFFAFALVFSRKSRADMLAWVRLLWKEARYSVKPQITGCQ